MLQLRRHEELSMPKTALADVRGKLRATFHAMLDNGGASPGQLVLRVKTDFPAEYEAAMDDLAGIGLGVLARAIVRTPSAQQSLPDQLNLPLALRNFVPQGAISVPNK
jgi:hypothetical protein